MTRDSFRKLFPALGVLLVAASGAVLAQERTVDPDSLATRTCEALIIDSIQEEFPKADGIAWDMKSVRESDVKVGLLLTGEGHYQGGSARRRVDFECIFDVEEEEVVSAWWVSSFDGERHVIVEYEGVSGWSPMKVATTCRRAVKEVIEEEFPSTVRKLDFIESTVERTEKGGVHEFSGEGRFQGGGGTWRRFTFECTFDENIEQVTEATWRHLGAEKDLDLD